MPEVVTDRAAFAATAATAPPGARVPVEVRVHVSDPFLAYRRAREGTGDAYLETTGGQSGWGYFGVTPADFLEVDPGGDTLGALDALLDSGTLVRGDCDVPYPCGAIGWLSYDVARELEALPSDAARDRDLPRLQIAVYDRLAAWEEPRDGEATTLRVTACPRVPDPDDPDSVAEAYRVGREHARELARRAVEGDPAIGPPPVEADAARFESDCTRAAFAERVRRVKEYIREGDTFQANVSQRLRAPAAVHPVAAFDALREVNPAPYSALLEFPGVDLVSASPELLLHRDGDRLVTEPIAGTRPRGATPAEDERLEADLLADEKERAEHAMLVDLERNDLGKVSEYGSVDVTEYRRVDRYSEVMHLVSLVEGRLREDADLADAVAAVFPGGTITGAPKPRTMEIIDEVEATRRGPYTGSIGIFGFDGRATLNIVIRTLVRYAEEYHLRVGAGIVHDSDPDREYAETLDKGRALVTAVDEALGERAHLSVEQS
ncbi:MULTISPECIES: aminodeoxychorismate synthase, component I [Salinibaculum]|uniref:aminodeoxychorismate synthase, component I n=1 Tax=Salinibaculum TaxID=2732368 RepID=UPI0030CE8B1F